MCRRNFLNNLCFLVLIEVLFSIIMMVILYKLPVRHEYEYIILTGKNCVHSTQYKNVWLAAYDLFHMFT